MNRSLSHYLLILFICLLSSCDEHSQPATNTAPANTLFPLQVGSAHLNVKLAVNDKERSRGLMHIKSLPDQEGMLFAFKEEQQLSFWMKETFIPLDIAYISSDGIIREIYPLYPHNYTSVSSMREDLMYALECNQDWFKKNNVRVGDSLDLKMIKTAIQARGGVEE